MKKNVLYVLVGVLLLFSISCSKKKEANPSDYVPDVRILISKNESTVVFQCKALQAGTHRLQVTFDDHVNDMVLLKVIMYLLI